VDHTPILVWMWGFRVRISRPHDWADRNFKPPSGTTSEYGRYVKSLLGAPWRVGEASVDDLAR